jgi:hypothetical protein
MTYSSRLRRLLAMVLVILAGLSLRRFGYDLGLSFFVVKYGGSVLWGAMVFFLVAFVLGFHSLLMAGGLALVIAVSVEFSRLFHTPELDAFRLTLAGKLLLGRVFSLWNILAYAIGIGLGVAVEICLSRLTVIKAGKRSPF